MIPWDETIAETLRHLQALIRIPTVNPPGNEKPAAEYLADVLAAEGYDPVVLESAPGRGNVVARYRGSGEAPPLLLLSHLDVVPVEPEKWEHDPFGGEVIDGYVWGRGALDMKFATAMQLTTMLLLARQKLPLKRDVVFAATADEEAGGRYGIGYLIDHHLEKIRAEYALTEFGGFPLNVGGKRIYLCQTAEKGICWVRMRARGAPGHGSVPHQDNAVVKLAEAVAKLGRSDLPFHRTDAVAGMVEGMAAALGGLRGTVLRGILNPTLSSLILHWAIRDPQQVRYFHALLHNTVSPTVLRAGSKTNVIPSEAEAELDGRILPGQDLDSFLAEVRAVVGEGFEFEPILVAPPVATDHRTPLFAVMAEGLRRHDPEAMAIVPMMVTGGTDAKHLARAGIPCYGFTPVQLPPEMNFMQMIHGHNERIPVDGLAFGVRVLYEVVVEFCQK
ncbi:MAG: M20/M25/M40 family metallo-hydrolase [Anaerolineae bacterium]|nr:M20/M25/M40 family metallo-hydrolase [Anaerolineae bacterium]MCX8067147.1 M20/M25/M40 family metallo-hydrolase [Anaerolineae bacterium]MDW7991942.1 M20/M25/M40 family metallo-hydrolase [Anaerolineae bacterium]